LAYMLKEHQECVSLVLQGVLLQKILPLICTNADTIWAGINLLRQLSCSDCSDVVPVLLSHGVLDTMYGLTVIQDRKVISDVFFIVSNIANDSQQAAE